MPVSARKKPSRIAHWTERLLWTAAVLAMLPWPLSYLAREWYAQTAAASAEAAPEPPALPTAAVADGATAPCTNVRWRDGTKHWNSI